jgi:hypothetical protein
MRTRTTLAIGLGVLAITAAGIAPAAAVPKKQPDFGWVTGLSIVNGTGCDFTVSGTFYHSGLARAQASLFVDPIQQFQQAYTGKGFDTFSWTFTKPAGPPPSGYSDSVSVNLINGNNTPQVATVSVPDC